MQRTIRYQGAIIHADHVLLIQHREHTTGHSYWLLPGGGREGDETEEACVQREIREETHLDVQMDAARSGGEHYPHYRMWPAGMAGQPASGDRVWRSC